MSDTRGGPLGRGKPGADVQTPNPFVAPRPSAPNLGGQDGTSFSHGQYSGPPSSRAPDRTPAKPEPAPAAAIVVRTPSKGLRVLGRLLMVVGLLVLGAAIASGSYVEKDKPTAPPDGVVLDARVRKIVPFGPYDVVALEPPAKPRDIITKDPTVQEGDRIWAAIDSKANAEEIVLKPTWPKYRTPLGAVGAAILLAGAASEVVGRTGRKRIVS